MSTFRGLPPMAATTYTPQLPSRSETNAISRPSGDQLGLGRWPDCLSSGSGVLRSRAEPPKCRGCLEESRRLHSPGKPAADCRGTRSGSSPRQRGGHLHGVLHNRGTAGTSWVLRFRSSTTFAAAAIRLAPSMAHGILIERRPCARGSLARNHGTRIDVLLRLLEAVLGIDGRLKTIDGVLGEAAMNQSCELARDRGLEFAHWPRSLTDNRRQDQRSGAATERPLPRQQLVEHVI